MTSAAASKVLGVWNMFEICDNVKIKVQKGKASKMKTL